MRPHAPPDRLHRLLAAAAALILFVVPRAAIAAEGAFAGFAPGTTTVSGDRYRAGLTPQVAEDVDGDLAVVGGDVRIDSRITGDLLAAGGRVFVAGQVGDDARLAGATVAIKARIGDHLMVVGDTVELRPGSEIVGDVRASGDRVMLGGRVHGPVEIAAERVQIRGRLDGHVRIKAERVDLGPSARIGGTLRYRAAAPATVADGARIRGELQYERSGSRPQDGRASQDGGAATDGAPAPRALLDIGAFALWVASAFVAAAVLNGLFPGFVRASERTAVERLWQSLGIGLVTLAAVPVVVIVLVALVVTLPLGLTLLALTPVAVLVGYLLFAFVVADRAARLVGACRARKFRRLLWLAGVLLALALIQHVPVLGFVLLVAGVVLGTGAGLVALTGYRRQAVGGEGR